MKRERNEEDELLERIAKEMMKSGDVKTAFDVEEKLRKSFGKVIKSMLEAEMDQHLGNDKYKHEENKQENYRNGYSKKKVKSNLGEIELEVPRDRKSEFEPVVVPKHSTDISRLETQTDNESGINISQTKWVLSKEAGNIGTEASSYTGGTFTKTPETITIPTTTGGTYYLHVLTVDNAGNKKEVISERIVIKSVPTNWKQTTPDDPEWYNYGQEVSGIWVAKFQASPEGATTDKANSQYSGTGKKLQVKPGVSSWRSIAIGNAYTVCLNYNSILNSHMMKNDEWGAVAYLSKSKYGKKNEEVWINNSSSFITGSAGNSASASTDTGTTNDYASTQGVKASTTGTVYGVYDMSGGAWEYVAAYVNNGHDTLTDYGSSLVNGDAKTKNVYSKGNTDNYQSNYEANKSKYGDAVWETI